MPVKKNISHLSSSFKETQFRFIMLGYLSFHFWRYKAKHLDQFISTANQIKHLDQFISAANQIKYLDQFISTANQIKHLNQFISTANQIKHLDQFISTANQIKHLEQFISTANSLKIVFSRKSFYQILSALSPYKVYATIDSLQ